MTQIVGRVRMVGLSEVRDAKAVRVRVLRVDPTSGELMGCMGVTFRYEAGWCFIPKVGTHQRSRRLWPTWQQCLPRWTGYPNSTNIKLEIYYA